MVKGRLPGEGPARLGPVTLPAGRLVMGYVPGEPIAWATVDPVPGSGRVWAALAGLHPQTGLVPIQLDGLGGDASNPWDGGSFIEPADPREADGLEAGTILRFDWRAWVPHPRQDDPELMRMRAPFTLEWPGLAQPERTPLTAAERQQALDVALPRIRRASGATPQARIGLVNSGESLLELTAVLRSWEDRFGARLIDVGYADLRLLAERPPRTLETAQRLAAEQVVLADDCIGGARDIPGIATRLVDGPIWTFWWD